MKTSMGLTLAGSIGGIALFLGAAPRAYTCSLTGDAAEECCCVEKDGSLYCQRAEQSVEACCCISSRDAA
jgi:hypothetical protein